MRNKYFLIFLAIALIQLCVPVYLIAKREHVLRTGTPFLFSTKPIDPYDAFRGRYVRLSYDFEEELAKVLKEKYHAFKELENVHIQKTVYASIANTPEGTAQISEISESPPGHSNYIQIKVLIEPRYYYFLDYRLSIDKFYMDEFDAPEAEIAYRNESSKKKAHALVYIKNGEAVLADLLIDKIPIRQYLKTAHENKIRR